jgi:hypothetical protein
MLERVAIQKNCEVISITPLEEKDTFKVRFLLMNSTEEFEPVPLVLKCTYKDIPTILSVLSDKYQALEHYFYDLNIAPITFTTDGKKVIATDSHGREILNAVPTAQKVKELSTQFFNSSNPK